MASASATTAPWGYGAWRRARELVRALLTTWSASARGPGQGAWAFASRVGQATVFLLKEECGWQWPGRIAEDNRATEHGQGGQQSYRGRLGRTAELQSMVREDSRAAECGQGGQQSSRAWSGRTVEQQSMVREDSRVAEHGQEGQQSCRAWSGRTAELQGMVREDSRAAEHGSELTQSPSGPSVLSQAGRPEPSSACPGHSLSLECWQKCVLQQGWLSAGHHRTKPPLRGHPPHATYRCGNSL